MTPEQKYALDSALIISSARGHLEMVACLLRAGADIHANDDAALVRASEEGHANVVRYLLIMGADTRGDEAVLRAAQARQIDSLRVLFNWAEEHPSPDRVRDKWAKLPEPPPPWCL